MLVWKPSMTSSTGPPRTPERQAFLHDTPERHARTPHENATQERHTRTPRSRTPRTNASLDRICTTTYYDVLRSTTTYHDVLRRTTTYYNVLRRTTTYYDVLRCTTTYYDVLRRATARRDDYNTHPETSTQNTKSASISEGTTRKFMTRKHRSRPGSSDAAQGCRSKLNL